MARRIQPHQHHNDQHIISISTIISIIITIIAIVLTIIDISTVGAPSIPTR